MSSGVGANHGGDTGPAQEHSVTAISRAMEVSRSNLYEKPVPRASRTARDDVEALAALKAVVGTAEAGWTRTSFSCFAGNTLVFANLGAERAFIDATVAADQGQLGYSNLVLRSRAIADNPAQQGGPSGCAASPGQALTVMACWVLTSLFRRRSL